MPGPFGETFSESLFGGYRAAQEDQLSRALAIADQHMKQAQMEHQKRMDEIAQKHQQAQEEFWKSEVKQRTEAVEANTKARQEANAFKAYEGGVPFDVSFMGFSNDPRVKAIGDALYAAQTGPGAPRGVGGEFGPPMPTPFIPPTPNVRVGEPPAGTGSRPVDQPVYGPPSIPTPFPVQPTPGGLPSAVVPSGTPPPVPMTRAEWGALPSLPFQEEQARKQQLADVAAQRAAAATLSAEVRASIAPSTIAVNEARTKQLEQKTKESETLLPVRLGKLKADMAYVQARGLATPKLTQSLINYRDEMIKVGQARVGVARTGNQIKALANARNAYISVAKEIGTLRQIPGKLDTQAKQAQIENEKSRATLDAMQNALDTAIAAPEGADKYLQTREKGLTLAILRARMAAQVKMVNARQDKVNTLNQQYGEAVDGLGKAEHMLTQMSDELAAQGEPHPGGQSVPKRESSAATRSNSRQQFKDKSGNVFWAHVENGKWVRE